MKNYLTRRTGIILSIILVLLGLDRVTKNIAYEKLLSSPPIHFLGGTVTLQYSLNPGAFLSLGAGLGEDFRFWIFTVIVSIFLAGILIYLVRKQDMDMPSTIALSLILGGGIGNLIDRITAGSVTDFIHMGLGPVRTGIFNVADMGITAGTIILIFLSFKQKPKRSK